MRDSLWVSTVEQANESTIELLVAAQQGDQEAKARLVVRAAPRLKASMRRRLPVAARAYQDTDDLVQETLLQTLRRLKQFNPNHSGAVPTYLRRAAMNRVRDEARKIGRRPRAVELDDRVPSQQPDPLAQALKKETRQRLRRALGDLRAKDRRLLVTHATEQGTLSDLAKRVGLRSAAATGMALVRAERRLKAQMKSGARVSEHK